MTKKDPGVDAYIAAAPEFARPILQKIRKLVHAADPEIEEGLKWRCPHFVHGGIVCGMAAFKNHCAVNFWKGKLIFGARLPEGDREAGMGQFGRLTSLADLPEDELFIGYVREAVRLNRDGIKLPAAPKKEKAELIVPPALRAALKKNKTAARAFESFSHSHRKEYVRWIAEAKTEATRARHVQTAITWLAEGKSRNWKYVNC